ncbi:transglutaminase-like domain-containing protein [Erythrobacter sp.]|jgi:transglutaminase-like putative cysteine protease|uniref:transglutaminase-like domain-containing protein n=1 Tax=Erythrobacter sp. TaxID=1042 RepID=UPI002ECF3CCF|nr:transglutaminase family protein [Erythrobacter sp.]
MDTKISSGFALTMQQPASLLLQFEAAHLPEQTVQDVNCRIDPADNVIRVPAQDNIGERLWLRAEGRIEVSYEARVEVKRQVHELAGLDALPPHKLPGQAVKYLFESRYCHSSEFLSFVESEFGGTSGGARIAAIRDWIEQTIDYRLGSSGPGTTATDTFHSKAGICRDFTHLLVTLARASTIPARYVACYAPGVDPQDFHAIGEVFLADPAMKDGGTWQLVDPTGMADLPRAVKIGVGRDAADVSFATSFAPMQFEYSKVEVDGA